MSHLTADIQTLSNRYYRLIREVKSLKRKIYKSADLWSPENDIAPGMVSSDFIYDLLSESKFNALLLEGNSFTAPTVKKDSVSDKIRLERACENVESILSDAYSRLGIDAERRKTMSGHDIGEWLLAEKQSFEDEPKTKGIKAYMHEQCMFTQDAMRKQMWCWRIGQEAEERQKMGWYPFFLTLTLDGNLFPYSKRAFWEEKRHLGNFIRSVGETVCKAMGHTSFRRTDNTKLEDYVVWQGHLEHGKSGEHHHMHIMLWLREIPDNWKLDPNRGRQPDKATNRNCPPLAAMWKWSTTGLSKAYYWRTFGDIWKELNFKWPVDDKGQSIKAGGVRQAGVYMIKYMTKDDKGWNHRIRGTRGLGMGTINQVINQMPLKHLEQLAIRPPEYEVSFRSESKTTIPLWFLRRLAADELRRRKIATGEFRHSKYFQDSKTHYRQLIERAFEGERLHRLSGDEKYQVFTDVLDETPEHYSIRKYFRAVRYLSRFLPPEVRREGDNQSLGGNSPKSTN